MQKSLKIIVKIHKNYIIFVKMKNHSSSLKKEVLTTADEVNF